jgi:hypothetical protein
MLLLSRKSLLPYHVENAMLQEKREKYYSGQDSSCNLFTLMGPVGGVSTHSFFATPGERAKPLLPEGQNLSSQLTNLVFKHHNFKVLLGGKHPIPILGGFILLHIITPCEAGASKTAAILPLASGP